MKKLFKKIKEMSVLVLNHYIKDRRELKLYNGQKYGELDNLPCKNIIIRFEYSLPTVDYI